MRMPRDMRQRLYQMTQDQERFEREHLRTPTAVELSERMGIAPEEFLALLALRTQNEAVSLDTPVGEEVRSWATARMPLIVKEDKSSMKNFIESPSFPELKKQARKTNESKE